MAEQAMHREVIDHYASGYERGRLSRFAGVLEYARTQELIRRYAPPAPAVVYDIGGGTGPYAFWLGDLGYQVHLIDILAVHVELAQQEAQHHLPLASIELGDARQVQRADGSADVVLMLGPFYHLVEQEDRLRAQREALRVLRPGGIFFAAAISRYASLMDGLFRGHLDDPVFVEIVRNDLATGQHRNPTNHPDYFSTTYFHAPQELQQEVKMAGFTQVETFAVEGPAWLSQRVGNHWENEERRERVFEAIRWIEQDPQMLGMSAHHLVVARKPAQDYER
jgi:SAM-dependent methyltransferase